MTKRTMWIYVGLCAVALVAAWRAAHTERAKKGGPSSTVLLAAEKGDVATVTLAWEKGASTVHRVADVPIVDVDRELPPPPVAKDADKAAPPPAPAREKATFPGARAVVAALEALEPLKTKRTLGAVDEARLRAMGLERPSRTLTVTTTRGRTLTLEIGEASYGAQGRYARVRGEAVVHLIDAAIVTGLEGGADTLLEKRPLTADLDQIRGVVVKSGERTASFVHVEREQASKRHFARRDDPGTTDEAAGKVVTTLRNLRGTKLADAGAKAGTVVAGFVVDAGGPAPLAIEISERGDGKGHVVGAGRFAWEISTTQAKELLEDIDAVFVP